MKMRTILVSALLLLSAAVLVCRLLKKKEPRIYLIYIPKAWARRHELPNEGCGYRVKQPRKSG